MGIPKTLKRNFLPYTFPLALSLSRAKKKSIPDKDMGIKKAHRLKNRTKNKVLTLQERAFNSSQGSLKPWSAGYKQADIILKIRCFDFFNPLK